MALRYGDEHGYLAGWDSDLAVAKELADNEWEHRGCMKYSGVVFLLDIVDDEKELIEVYRKGL